MDNSTPIARVNRELGTPCGPYDKSHLSSSQYGPITVFFEGDRVELDGVAIARAGDRLKSLEARLGKPLTLAKNRRLWRLDNGDLFVESVQGVILRFTVWLPRPHSERVPWKAEFH